MARCWRWRWLALAAGWVWAGLGRASETSRIFHPPRASSTQVRRGERGLQPPPFRGRKQGVGVSPGGLPHHTKATDSRLGRYHTTPRELRTDRPRMILPCFIFLLEQPLLPHLPLPVALTACLFSLSFLSILPPTVPNRTVSLHRLPRVLLTAHLCSSLPRGQLHLHPRSSRSQECRRDRPPKKHRQHARSPVHSQFFLGSFSRWSASPPASQPAVSSQGPHPISSAFA